MVRRSNLPRKAGKKNRKYGRNKKWCEVYRMRSQRERNKVRKLARHLKKYPHDATAKKALRSLS